MAWPVLGLNRIKLFEAEEAVFLKGFRKPTISCCCNTSQLCRKLRRSSDLLSVLEVFACAFKACSLCELHTSEQPGWFATLQQYVRRYVCARICCFSLWACPLLLFLMLSAEGDPTGTHSQWKWSLGMAFQSLLRQHKQSQLQVPLHLALSVS